MVDEGFDNRYFLQVLVFSCLTIFGFPNSEQKGSAKPLVDTAANAHLYIGTWKTSPAESCEMSISFGPPANDLMTYKIMGERTEKIGKASASEVEVYLGDFADLAFGGPRPSLSVDNRSKASEPPLFPECSEDFVYFYRIEEP